MAHVSQTGLRMGPSSSISKLVKILLPWEWFCVIASSGIFKSFEASVTSETMYSNEEWHQMSS